MRAATTADAESVAAIYPPMVTGTAISFEETAPGPEEIGRRMLASPRLPWLVADDAGRVVGYAYASTHRQRPAYRWSADCSVYLDPAYRARGLGRLLYEQLISVARELGYMTLYAGIALPNEPSVGLHEAMGFRPTGVFRNVGCKLGAWRDVGWWHLPLRDVPAGPEEPRPWAPGEPGASVEPGAPREPGASGEPGAPREPRLRAPAPGPGEAGRRGQP